MFLHVGLGNPGNLYRNHRHNVGFMAIDHLIEFYNIPKSKNKFNGEYAKINKANGASIFFKPNKLLVSFSLCNLSGRCF